MTKQSRKQISVNGLCAEQDLDGRPKLLAWSCGHYANYVRDEIGDTWDTHGEGPDEGWRRAKKSGVRIRKVKITTIDDDERKPNFGWPFDNVNAIILKDR